MFSNFCSMSLNCFCCSAFAAGDAACCDGMFGVKTDACGLKVLDIGNEAEANGDDCGVPCNGDTPVAFGAAPNGDGTVLASSCTLRWFCCSQRRASSSSDLVLTFSVWRCAFVWAAAAAAQYSDSSLRICTRPC